MGGSNSVPTDRIVAREICVYNDAAFVLRAQVLGCDMKDQTFPVDQQVCFNLDQCHLAEGTGVTLRSTASGSFTGLFVGDPYLDYGFDYSRYAGRYHFVVGGTQNFFDVAIAGPMVSTFVRPPVLVSEKLSSR